MKKALIIMLIGLNLGVLPVSQVRADENMNSYTLSENNIVYKTEKKTVIIDYCHRAVNPNGIIDRGASSKLYGRVYYEDDIANDISHDIGKKLEEKGYNVIYTRSIGGTISLTERVKMCNEIPDSSLYFSLHLNATEKHNASGTMGFSNTQQELNEMLTKELSTKYGFKNKGIHEDPYYTRRIKNSVLYELGFIDSEEDLKIILNNQKNIANDIAEIINDYLN